jgi:hypothetical protein
LTTARGRKATPSFADAHGRGRRVVLSGDYRRRDGRMVARTAWTLTTTASGVRLAMRMPAKAALRTTLWLPGASTRLSAPGATFTRGACTVTASGRACPVTISWRERRAAALEISS